MLPSQPESTQAMPEPPRRGEVPPSNQLETPGNEPVKPGPVPETAEEIASSIPLPYEEEPSFDLEELNTGNMFSVMQDPRGEASVPEEQRDSDEPSNEDSDNGSDRNSVKRDRKSVV